MTVHQFQHRIATALQRNMVMRHKSPALCTVVYQLGAQQVGFQTTDTITLNTFNGIQCLHQIDEFLACRLAEVTNVHTRQHNLLTTFAGGFLSLCHQRGNGWVTTETTGIGYRTIGTEVVAAVLNLQEIAGAIAS